MTTEPLPRCGGGFCRATASLGLPRRADNSVERTFWERRWTENLHGAGGLASRNDAGDVKFWRWERSVRRDISRLTEELLRRAAGRDHPHRSRDIRRHQ